ncbi:MAG: hypothetical protein H6R18_168, partial [Proteobacteria bacterium]|nr:hypothetical protein [Pseudomonadota bacterium]
MKIKKLSIYCLSALMALSIAACGKKEAPPAPPAPTPVQTPAPVVKAPIAFKAVVLGNKIDETKKVAAPLSSFGPMDTIYAVVETDGSGDATIKAKWTFHKGAKSANVSETTQTIKGDGPANHEFHISKPDGWPVGDYK